MPTTVRGEALERKDKPLYKFSIEKESKKDWVNAEQKASFDLPSARAENFIDTSIIKDKVFVISKPAYNIDEEYFSASKSFIYLTFFTSYDYEIKKPLPVTIERGIEPNVFLICNEELNKCGIGFSKEEALKEFEVFIITDYKTLKESSAEELSEDAKELLNLYDSYIEL